MSLQWNANLFDQSYSACGRVVVLQLSPGQLKWRTLYQHITAAVYCCVQGGLFWFVYHCPVSTRYTPISITITMRVFRDDGVTTDKLAIRLPPETWLSSQSTTPLARIRRCVIKHFATFSNIARNSCVIEGNLVFLRFISQWLSGIDCVVCISYLWPGADNINEPMNALLTNSV